jgi:hypothetical protein
LDQVLNLAMKGDVLIRGWGAAALFQGIRGGSCRYVVGLTTPPAAGDRGFDRHNQAVVAVGLLDEVDGPALDVFYAILTSYLRVRF